MNAKIAAKAAPTTTALATIAAAGPGFLSWWERLQPRS
jgi:hypothetical protein